MGSEYLRDPLWQRLAEFRIDEGRSRLSFARRLARENAWSEPAAERVIAEYYRFLYLCMRAGHPCTPSVAVDQAWHLHLTYTRSYWERLCPEVLETPLHHGPTAGGGDERAKYHDWYSKTLASYERLFGEPPPSDLWPPPRERFAGVDDQRWVDTRRSWVIPKPSWRHAPPWAGLLVAGALTGCLPLALLDAPAAREGFASIGTISILVSAACLAIGLLLRLGADGQVRSQDIEGNDELLGWTTGGVRRLLEVAFASLLADGRLQAERQQVTTSGFVQVAEVRVRRGQQPPPGATELELALWKAAPAEPEKAVTIDELAEGASSAVENTRRAFMQAGLIGPDERVFNRRSWSCATFMVGAVANLALFVAALNAGIEEPVYVTFMVGALCVVLAVWSRSRFLRSGAARRITAMRRRDADPGRESAAAETVPPARTRRSVALFGARDLLSKGPAAHLAAAATAGALADWSPGLLAPHRRNEGDGGCFAGYTVDWGGGDGGGDGGCGGCGGCGG